MDKVIIDNVDVSECNYALTPKKQCPNKSMYYAKETSCIACKEHNTKLNFCKNNPNCYYKQLKRLKEENERIKRDFLKQNQWLQDQKKEIDELKAENERLKEDVRYYKELTRDTNILLKQAHQNFTEHIQKQKLEIDNYRSVLQEIREIASFHTSNEDSEDVQSDMQDILTKINEALQMEN